jgi:hypothetical protein
MIFFIAFAAEGMKPAANKKPCPTSDAELKIIFIAEEVKLPTPLNTTSPIFINIPVTERNPLPIRFA